MRRFVFCLGIVALVAGFVGTPDASAQQQSVNFFVGGFNRPAARWATILKICCKLVRSLPNQNGSVHLCAIIRTPFWKL